MGKIKTVLLILCVSFFMRFYRLGDFFLFDLDVEYLAHLAQTIIHNFHIIWIGVSAGATNYYLGPGYVYLTALILFFKQPLALGIVASTLGVITTYVVYFCTKKLYGKNYGIYAGLLYAGSAGASLLDRRWWPPAIGLVGLGFLWVLERTRHNQNWFLFGAFLMALSLHLHVSLVVFFPLMAWALWRERKNTAWHTYVAGALIYILGTLPLSVYDVVHNFDNARAPFAMLASGSTTGLAFHPVTFTILGSFWFPHAAVFSLLTCASIVVAFKKKLVLPAVITGVYSLLFLFFPGPVQLYYGAILMSFIAITGSALLAVIPRALRILCIVLFISVNVVYMLRAPPAHDSYRKKMEVVKNIKEKYGNAPLRLTVVPSYRASGGWHYLLYNSGVRVVSGSSDEFYKWIYEQYMNLNLEPQYNVTIDGN